MLLQVAQKYYYYDYYYCIFIIIMRLCAKVRGERLFLVLHQSRSGAGVLWILQWSLNPEYISLQRSAVDLAHRLIILHRLSQSCA